MAVEVVVAVHEHVRPLLRAWRQALADDPEIRRQLASAYWDAFTESVRTAGGCPRDGVRDASTVPPTFLVELSGGYWLRCVLRPDERVGLFARRREVVVVNLVSRPHD
jgi:hypothetical protein